MTVSIKNVENGEGFFPYTMEKNGELRQEATLLRGDAELGNIICKSINYKSGNAVNFVISFADEDGVTPKKARKIVDEFFEKFMHGFSKDEYHIDIVEHNDTDHLHYHARVPKLNLLTNTQLKLYWHKADLGFKKALIADICHRHDLVTGEQMRKTVKNPNEKIERIQKWREERHQPTFSFSRKKDRAEAEHKINEYIFSLVSIGELNSLEEVKSELGLVGLKIAKEGYDKGKDFHYLTITNESGKLRIKGDIYGGEFYQLPAEDRRARISSNRSNRKLHKESRRDSAEIERELHKHLKNRLRFINQQYGRARDRASARLNAEARESYAIEAGRNIEKMGISNGQDTGNNIKKEREIGDAVVGGEQAEELRSEGGNIVHNMDDSGSSRHSISIDQSSDIKARDNARSSERAAAEGVQYQRDEEWLDNDLQERGIDDDSTGTEIIERIGKIRSRTRSRTSVNKRVHDGYIQSLIGYKKAERRDYRSFADATSERKLGRAFRRLLGDAINKVIGKFEAIQSGISEYRKELFGTVIEGVANYANDKKIEKQAEKEKQKQSQPQRKKSCGLEM